MDLIKGPLSPYSLSMFDIYCPRHRARVLLGSRSIESVVNTDDGIVVHWRCRCGEHGAFVTGRRNPIAQAGPARQPESVAPAA
jgi:hypothetical protein